MSDPLITLERARRAVLAHRDARDALVAPGFTADLPKRWEGRIARKPWEYHITAVIPHVGPPLGLAEVIDLLRLQTEPPYIMVIDTGSPRHVHEDLEKLRAEDTEIHYLRKHAYQHSSAPVSAAMDVGFALCSSPFLFAIHNDCFLRRRNFLEALLDHCDSACPVIGYQQSPREKTQRWQGTVSHTATLFHMPTMRRINARWSFEAYWEKLGHRPKLRTGYPDTEQPFDLCLREAGISPRLIGKEDNFRRFLDTNLDHARSYTGTKLYARGANLKHLEDCSDRQFQSALFEARQRIQEWRGQ